MFGSEAEQVMFATILVGIVMIMATVGVCSYLGYRMGYQAGYALGKSRRVYEVTIFHNRNQDNQELADQ